MKFDGVVGDVVKGGVSYVEYEQKFVGKGEMGEVGMGKVLDDYVGKNGLIECSRAVNVRGGVVEGVVRVRSEVGIV